MLYSFVKFCIKMFVYIYHRIEVVGLNNLPSTGSLIIVGNHVSYLDPIYIGALLPRKVHFMAKQEAFRFAFSRFFLKISGSFPVNREKPDLQTFKTALYHLNNQEVIGIFPEGAIMAENSFQDIKQGAAFLAAKSGATIVPVYIDGTKKAMEKISFVKPVKIRLIVGEPIAPDNEGKFKEQQLNLSSKIQQSLIQLGDVAAIHSK